MSSVKKTTTKKTVAKVAPTHPKFIEMIKQCIIDTKEDSRIGVSRPQIKQYLASHYKLDMSSKANIGHLNRGISQGTLDNVFILPKGISGRVKLNKIPAADKENVKPVSASKPTSVKAPAAKPAAAKKAAPVKKAAAPVAKKAAPKKAAAPAAKKAAPVKKATAIKKATPAAKKAATKTKSSTSKAATATKAKAAPKKAVAKKGPAAKPAAKKAAPRKVAAKK